MSLLILGFLASRAFAAAPADFEARCAAHFTPEKLLQAKLPEDENGTLFDYATCVELHRAGPSLCRYLPGGPDSSVPPSKAPRGYTWVDSKGRMRYESEYEICSTKAPGYAFLAAVVGGARREELVATMKTLLKGSRDVTPEQAVAGSLEIYARGRVETSRIPAKVLDVGFFHYLAGPKACRAIRMTKVRRECLAKAAAIEALKARDPKRCADGDEMCRGLLQGEGACAESGREAVRLYCKKNYSVELQGNGQR